MWITSSKLSVRACARSASDECAEPPDMRFASGMRPKGDIARLRRRPHSSSSAVLGEGEEEASAGSNSGEAGSSAPGGGRHSVRRRWRRRRPRIVVVIAQMKLWGRDGRGAGG